MPTRLFAVSDDSAWPIIKTIEKLAGSNGIENDVGQVKQLPDGTFEFDFDGNGTDVDWDSQETVTNSVGQRMFYDEDYDEWAESDCMLLEVDEDGDPLRDEDGEFIQADASTSTAAASSDEESDDDDTSYSGSVRFA